MLVNSSLQGQHAIGLVLLVHLKVNRAPKDELLPIYFFDRQGLAADRLARDGVTPAYQFSSQYERAACKRQLS